VPATDSPSLAFERAPSQLVPWYGPPRKFSYRTEVQPVFDKHCVSCHDFGKEAGKKLNLAGDLGLIFNTSYGELRSKRYVHVAGAGPHTVLPPKSWGSHVSPLVRVLLEGHQDPQLDKEIELDKQSFDRIVTWIDINAPYYPDYASAYPGNEYGRSPLDHAQLKQLSELTRFELRQPKFASYVNFTRPERSVCLTRFKEKGSGRYAEALSIIRAGQQMLAERPRADMRGFQLTGTDLRREIKYAALVETTGGTSETVLRPTQRNGTASNP